MQASSIILFLQIFNCCWHNVVLVVVTVAVIVVFVIAAASIFQMIYEYECDTTSCCTLLTFLLYYSYYFFMSVCIVYVRFQILPYIFCINIIQIFICIYICMYMCEHWYNEISTFIHIFFVILCKVQFHRVSKVFWYNSKKKVVYIHMYVFI